MQTLWVRQASPAPPALGNHHTSPEVPTPTMDMTLEQIRELTADDMRQVDQVITRRLSSDVALINQLGAYIIHSGGKRFRPLLHILAARALCPQADGKTQEHAAELAAVVEFIHTATLLHDDVVDESTLRRGNETANAAFGNAASILTGDFLYSRAFEMMVSVNKPEVMAVLSSATNRIAEGEVMQLMNIGDADLSEARYLEVIDRKTATLFAAATRLAGVLTDQPASVCQALDDYGTYLGRAFQITDDLLDYRGDEAETGKHIGDDLAEGKPTLPLIRAMTVAAKHDDTAMVTLIRHAIEAQTDANLEKIIAAVERTGALDYTSALAKQAAKQAIGALSILPDNAYRDALASLAVISVERNH